MIGEKMENCNKNFKIIVECPGCHNKQEEMIMKGDKFCYICKNCEGLVEGDGLHILQGNCRVIADHGGNVCTGFGGLLGEVHYRTKINNKKKPNNI